MGAMSKSIAFEKGHGTGNDFVLIDDPDGDLHLAPGQIARLCDRHRGIGADGLIRVVHSEHLPEGRALLKQEPAAVWFMDYWNADGSVAEMCGNGVRVFAEHLLQHGLADIPKGSTLPVATRAGIKDIAVSHVGYLVDMGRWRPDPVEYRVRTWNGSTVFAGHGIDVGNPHVVVEVGSLDELAQLDLTRPPILDPKPVHGANVEFFVRLEAHEGVQHVRMRVHERGVGETMSCGTGTLATALAARESGDHSIQHWRVDVPGGTIAVRMFPTEEGEHVSLAGPAVIVYRGQIALD